MLKAKLYLSANLYTRRERKEIKDKEKYYKHACTYLLNVKPKAWTFKMK